MLTAAQIVIMGTGTVLLGAWIALFVRGRRHAALFETLDPKAYPFKELYPIGFELLERVGYGYRTRADVQLRQLMEIIFGARYSEFYLRTVRAQQVVTALTGTIAAIGVYGLTNDVQILALMLVCALLAAYYFSERLKTQVRERNAEMVRDFSEVVSTLALLTSAGMILREAWLQTSRGGDSAIYREMRRSVEQMENGESDVVAIQDFGTRSTLPQVKKLAALLIQSIQRGGADLPAMLTQQSSEAWQAKKQIVQRQSNKAGTKLLAPMMLMFGGILLMVLVPMFTGVGF